MQFSEAIMEYSFDCKIRKLSAKTIENYQKQLRYGADNTAVLLRVFGWNNIKLIYMDADAYLHAAALADFI